ncbi:MAG TPA: RsmE family RNA methyltransferase [Dehalococcoidia bacterium]|nr:RsmE family RNA methyltransferase [Dehalococcoidia bacterium]
MAGEPRRFFVPEGTLDGTDVRLIGDLAHRLARVLRLRPGDRIVLTEGGERQSVVELTEVSPKAVAGDVVGEEAAPEEASVEVVLYQSLIRPNRFDFALEKCTELGVSRFVPVVNARSQLDEASSGQTERWHRIVVEAAEQCERGRLPQIEAPMAFVDAIASAPGLRILPYEAEREVRLADFLRALPERPTVVSLFIGPEGGYTDEEIALAREAGAALVTLSRQVLRSETAAVVAAGIVLHELDQ